jgi:hypothetical protein
LYRFLNGRARMRRDRIRYEFVRRGWFDSDQCHREIRSAVFSMQIPETTTRGITLMISVLQNSTMRKCSERFLLDQSF